LGTGIIVPDLSSALSTPPKRSQGGNQVISCNIRARLSPLNFKRAFHMHTDYTFAPWGMAFAALMFVVGNAVWINHLARQRPWLGWLMWSISAALILLLGAIIELRLGGGAGVWDKLTSVNVENHWIVVTLYALMSIPGAASVLFRQDTGWTRLGVLATALIVFIPLGAQLGDRDNSRLLLSLGITLAICGLIVIWSMLLDCDPAHKRKTVPLAETSK